MKRLLLIMLAICTLAGCSKDNDPPKEIELTGGTQIAQEVYADETSKIDGIKFKGQPSRMLPPVQEVAMWRGCN